MTNEILKKMTKKFDAYLITYSKIVRGIHYTGILSMTGSERRLLRGSIL